MHTRLLISCVLFSVCGLAMGDMYKCVRLDGAVVLSNVACGKNETTISVNGVSSADIQRKEQARLRAETDAKQAIEIQKVAERQRADEKLQADIRQLAAEKRQATSASTIGNSPSQSLSGYRSTANERLGDRSNQGGSTNWDRASSEEKDEIAKRLGKRLRSQGIGITDDHAKGLLNYESALSR